MASGKGHLHTQARLDALDTAMARKVAAWKADVVPCHMRIELPIREYVRELPFVEVSPHEGIDESTMEVSHMQC